MEQQPMFGSLVTVLHQHGNNCIFCGQPPMVLYPFDQFEIPAWGIVCEQKLYLCQSCENDFKSGDCQELTMKFTGSRGIMSFMIYYAVHLLAHGYMQAARYRSN